MELDKAGEVIGITVRDDHGIHDQRLGRGRPRVSGSDVAREQLDLTRIDENHLLAGRLEDHPVALLHVDHGESRDRRAPDCRVLLDEPFVDAAGPPDHPDPQGVSRVHCRNTLERVAPIILPGFSVVASQINDIVVEERHRPSPPFARFGRNSISTAMLQIGIGASG